MVWISFLTTAALIVIAATQLARYGEVIAIRTKLGGMFIGVVLLAAATSLPEVLTSISAVAQGAPNLAAGNLLGSNMFNMFLLAVLDMSFRRKRILRNAALKHALTGSLAVFMIGLVVFFMLADFTYQPGWAVIDSLIIMAVYFGALWLIQTNQNHGKSQIPGPVEIPGETPSLRTGLIGFSLAAAALLVITPLMVRSSTQIAEITGLGTTFIGATLVALVTSLPELVATIAAIRIGAEDMAVSNLFGSNLFNMFAIGLTGLFFLPGNFLASIDPAFVLVGMLGLLMTAMGLIGNLARLEKRVLFIELDALALIITYFGGMWLLYLRGVAG